MSCYHDRLWKGTASAVTFGTGVEDLSGFTLSMYTDGPEKVYIPMEQVSLSGGLVTVTLSGSDLDVLDEGVLRYTLANEDLDIVESNNLTTTLKTPEDYSGKTGEQLYEDGYEAGYGEGEEAQKARLTNTTATTNGTYTREDGYKKVVVNVPQSRLQTKNLTYNTNGTFAYAPDSRYDGIAGGSVTVNVPTGHTEEEVEEAYESGYTEGYAQGQEDCPGGGTYYRTIEEKSDFLWEAVYDYLDYDYARDYFEERAVPVVGGCSAVRRGNYVDRNYDWYYNNQVEFVLQSPNVVGVAGIKDLELGFDPYDEAFHVLPFYLQDGINRDGLFAEVNVVPQHGNIETHPEHQTDRVCSIMLVRYILDNYKSVDEAVSALTNVQIYNPEALLAMDYELHWLLADSAKTVVLEIVEGELVAVESEISTNFHLNGVTFNQNGTVNTPETVPGGHMPYSNHIESYGTGLERYNLIVSGAERTDLFFSKAYSTPWYSDFVGGNISVDTPYNDLAFQTRISNSYQHWVNRDRNNPEVWHTAHSCRYNLSAQTVSIIPQETLEDEYETDIMLAGCKLQEKEYEFSGNGAYAIGPDEGYDGLSVAEVSINVPVPTITSEKRVTYTENGHYTVYASPEADGMRQVVVDVAVEGGGDTGNTMFQFTLTGVPSVNNQVFYKDAVYTNTGIANILSYTGFTNTYEGKVTMIGGGRIIHNSLTYGSVWLSSKLKTITIPESVKYIGAYAFYNCTAMTQCNLPSGLVSIESGCFEECKKLNNITIPSNVAVIKNVAFKNCSALTSIDLSETQVYNIGTQAFWGCSALQDVVLPSTLEGLEQYVFQYTDLRNFTCYATTPPSKAGDPFPETLEHIYVPASAVTAYKSAPYWDQYANIISAIGGDPEEYEDPGGGDIEF